ncbi:hypothetical protein AMTRI_Chr05g61070 [Amborella trichopoda]
MGLSIVVREREFRLERGKLGTHSSIHQSLTNRYSDWIHEALNELPSNCLCKQRFPKYVGYSRDKIIGKNGRIFQGPDTDRKSVLQIRKAIREDKTLRISLLNYRKNGTPIWILFHLCLFFHLKTIIFQAFSDLGPGRSGPCPLVALSSIFNLFTRTTEYIFFHTFPSLEDDSCKLLLQGHHLRRHF